MQPFQNQIDERANSDYNAEGYYDDLYGSLCGWTKFETPSRVFFGVYRKGEIVGNAIVKTYENFGVLSNHWSRRSRFYEDFEIEASSEYAFRFYRDVFTNCKAQQSPSSLASLEQNFETLGLNLNDLSNFSFFLGFAERVAQFFFVFRVSEQARAEPLITSFAGQAFKSDWVIDNQGDVEFQSGSLLVHLSKCLTDLGEGFNRFEDDVLVDHSFLKLIATVAVYNWSLRNNVSLADDFSHIRDSSFLKQTGRILELIDFELLTEINDGREIGESTFLEHLFKLNLGLGQSFRQNWFMGCCVGDLFFTDFLETKFLLDFVFSPVLNSSLFLDSTISVQTARWLDDRIRDNPQKKIQI